jgi:indolepyruvate ferredoxin oxidoreductase
VTLHDVTLDDKYDLGAQRIFVSGTQAVVRLALMQKERDRRAGLNTAGYVSGYRGSPLGGLDHQFARAKRVLEPNDIRFQPGLNEDLAATALWGSQQAEMRGDGRFDGVFGIWYGKGPGVDRTGDVFRHANQAGTSPHGGVLALMGDDHTAESSTVAHQSEFALVDVMMPVLNPAGVQEILDFGLYGWALSRYAGVWVGLKCVKDTVESTASIDGTLDRVSIVIPEDFEMPPGGLNIRPNDPPLVQEARLHDFKRYAILAFMRANRLDRMLLSGGPNPRLGIATVGKSYLDVVQALAELGIDEVRAAALGLRLYKVAMPWPLEPSGVERFADGLERIMVVEEKRSLIETQIREQLYGRANAPVVVGKRDEENRPLFPAKGALDSNEIAIAIGRRILERTPDEAIAARVAHLEEAQQRLKSQEKIAERVPHFCAGCPHNSSTVIPEGSRAYAGIGCHYMVQWMERGTEGFTQMGGEGANWVGEAPFSKRGHVFQNLGDGTYNHSGYLAIRAAKAAGVNITYKILYNDAVAMTGGQTHEGGLTVPEIAHQVRAEGAKRIAIVSDEPEKYGGTGLFPEGATVHHRDELMTVQQELAAIEGLTILIYDQTCAAEKRRRRKRGTFPDPDKRVVINELVCEGCGDCGVKSNCVAVQPVATEFGRRRQIDQSACNKDFSCLNGFCPSFVTVKGGALRKGTGVAGSARPWPDLPEPSLPALDDPYAVVITGIGGTGVVTIGAILGMAAHLEGKGVGVIDMAGLAQKGGAVVSHLKIAARPEDISAIRVAAGEADLVLGCDIVVAGTERVLGTMEVGRTTVVANLHETYPGTFTRQADFSLPTRRIMREIDKRVDGAAHFLDATRIATGLFGDSIAANLFMLGVAYQLGRVPLTSAAIDRAIELNGAAVEQNRAAFLWGRRAAADRYAVEALVAPQEEAFDWRHLSVTLDEVVARRVAFLTDYQNARYAERYRRQVQAAQAAELEKTPGQSGFADAVARNLFKLMAYKDEYEVARLYTDGRFKAQLESLFEGDYTLEVHLAPPLFARRDPVSGEPRKKAYGPRMLKAFHLLSRLRAVRGTPLDLFGYTSERRLERRLIREYEALVKELVAGLTPETHAVAVSLASIPEKIRGYGHVKRRHLDAAQADRAELLEAFRAGGFPHREAAE